MPGDLALHDGFVLLILSGSNIYSMAYCIFIAFALSIFSVL